jgi:hypothetical protein
MLGELDDVLDAGLWLALVHLVADFDLDDFPLEAGEGPLVAGLVAPGGFADATELDVAVLAEVDVTGVGQVDEEPVDGDDLLTLELFFNGFVEDAVLQRATEVGLGRVFLARKRFQLDVVDDGFILADRNGASGRRGCGTLELRVEKLLYVDHNGNSLLVNGRCVFESADLLPGIALFVTFLPRLDERAEVCRHFAPRNVACFEFHFGGDG